MIELSKYLLQRKRKEGGKEGRKERRKERGREGGS